MDNIKILNKQVASFQAIEPLKSKMKLICSDKIHVISKSEILYLKSDSNYCEVVLVDGRSIYCSQTLKSIEFRLPNSQFFRPHQSYVFNVKFLESVCGSMSRLNLIGDIVIPIARRSRAELKRMLEIWFD